MLTIISTCVFERIIHADTPMVIINRVYNPNTGEHVYTNSAFEETRLVDIGWKYEGNAFFVPNNMYGIQNPKNVGPLVSRLYNPNAGDHFYTSNEYEISELLKKGWTRDQINFTTAKVGLPVYRLYNPNAKVGSHLYTLSSYERDNLINHGWRYEGVAFYSLPKP